MVAPLLAAGAQDGVTRISAGAGLVTANVTPLDVPPPLPGFTAVMVTAAPVAS